MDSRTQLPVRGRRVLIAFSGPDGQFYNKPAYKIGHTDRDGLAAFRVKEPVPPSVWVVLWYVDTCSDNRTFSTRAVLEDGVVSSCRPTEHDKSYSAALQTPQPREQPGKIVIFVHPINRLVWAWHDTLG